MKKTTKSTQQTQKLGEKIGREALKKTDEVIIIVLSGDLGTGKTTLVKGIAKGLGIKDNIVSPTFTLIQSYSIGPQRTLYHIDPYRLKNPNDMVALGFKELITQKGNIIIIEWGERLKDYLPEHVMRIELWHREDNNREIIISK